MHVALVCPYDIRRPGGVRSHIAGLGEALVARGHSVEIIAPSPPGRLGPLEIVSCGASREFAFGGTHIDMTWAAWRRVAEVSRRGYDVLHFHTIWNPLMPLQLATVFRGPAVATFHDVPSADTPWWASRLMPLGSAVIQRVWLDRVIAVSPVVAAYLPAGRFEIIPNGLTLPGGRLPPEPSGEREAVLYLGRLEPRKGIRTLIDAIPQFGAGDRPPPVWIAGAGYLRPELERQVAERGLRTVTFFGEVSDDEKWSLLRRARVVVAPSPAGESFGIVLLEAMAAGAPPVAADNPGYRAVMRGRGSALLFPPGDAPALAARVRLLLESDAERCALKAWGEAEHRQYAWPLLAERVERVYLAACEESRKRRTL